MQNALKDAGEKSGELIYISDFIPKKKRKLWIIPVAAAVLVLIAMAALYVAFNYTNPVFSIDADKVGYLLVYSSASDEASTIYGRNEIECAVDMMNDYRHFVQMRNADAVGEYQLQFVFTNGDQSSRISFLPDGAAKIEDVIYYSFNGGSFRDFYDVLLPQIEE